MMHGILIVKKLRKELGTSSNILMKMGESKHSITFVSHYKLIIWLHNNIFNEEYQNIKSEYNLFRGE